MAEFGYSAAELLQFWILICWYPTQNPTGGIKAQFVVKG